MQTFDTRPMLDRWEYNPANDLVEAVANYGIAVDDYIEYVTRTLDRVVSILDDSRRVEVDDLHDDEVRRVLAEVLAEVRTAYNHAWERDPDHEDRIARNYLAVEALAQEVSAAS